MEAQVISQGCRCGIFGEQSRTGAGLRSVLFGTHPPLTVPFLTHLLWDWDSVEGSGTQHGMEYPGFEPRWRREIFSISVQDLTGVHPASSTMGTQALSWEYSGQSV